MKPVGHPISKNGTDVDCRYEKHRDIVNFPKCDGWREEQTEGLFSILFVNNLKPPNRFPSKVLR